MERWAAHWPSCFVTRSWGATIPSVLVARHDAITSAETESLAETVSPFIGAAIPVIISKETTSRATVRAGRTRPLRSPSSNRQELQLDGVAQSAMVRQVRGYMSNDLYEATLGSMHRMQTLFPTLRLRSAAADHLHGAGPVQITANIAELGN